MTRPLDESHDPALRSWVESANRPDSDFPIQNLPFGAFRRRGSNEPHRLGVAIGDDVLDLLRCGELGLLQELPAHVQAVLRNIGPDGWMTLGVPALRMLRRCLVRLLSANSSRAEPGALVAMADVALAVPSMIGDYTDFYASIFHATRVGTAVSPDNPLLPNYKYVPSGITGARRPWWRAGPRSDGRGGRSPDRATHPASSDTHARLRNGGGLVRRCGQRAWPANADRPGRDRISSGCVWLNDWSARDIQAWEYQPLGPFLAKNFATTVSPWVVTWKHWRRSAPLRFSGRLMTRAACPTCVAANTRGRVDVQLEVAFARNGCREGHAPVRSAAHRSAASTGPRRRC